MTEPASPARDDTDRQIGWLIALASLVSIAGQALPGVAQQAGLFTAWWTVGGWIAMTAIVVLAAAGRWLPLRLLRWAWIAIPVLVIALQLLSYAAYTGRPGGVVPWVWALEPCVASLLVLTLSPVIAVGVAIGSGLTVAVSAWIFTGAVPQVIASSTPIHMSNVAFTVLFIGIRGRLTRLRELEAKASAAAERRAQSAADAQRRATFSRLVHDEVLSVLSAAMLFRGEPPDVHE